MHATILLFYTLYFIPPSTQTLLSRKESLPGPDNYQVHQQKNSKSSTSRLLMQGRGSQ